MGCHFLLQCMKMRSESEVTQSCPTLSDPMNCSLPGSSVHGIFQARVLEWGAIAFSAFYLQLVTNECTRLCYSVTVHIGLSCLFQEKHKKSMTRHIRQRRQWQPIPVLLPGKSHGRRSLVGCSTWSHEELNTTERFTFTFHFHAVEKEMATHSSVLA